MFFQKKESKKSLTKIQQSNPTRLVDEAKTTQVKGGRDCELGLAIDGWTGEVIVVTVCY